MFSGNEWLVVVAIFLLVVLLVAVVLLLGPRRRSETPRVQEARVRGEIDAVLQDVQLAVSGLQATSVRRDPGDVVVLERSSVPTWAIVVAILCFPIGLVALVARTVETASVAATAGAGATTTLRISGTFRKPAAAAINSVISARS